MQRVPTLPHIVRAWVLLQCLLLTLHANQGPLMAVLLRVGLERRLLQTWMGMERSLCGHRLMARVLRTARQASTRVEPVRERGVPSAGNSRRDILF
ncbi:hypothetical protein NITLEN_40366 [Nitrospira lenta]|uniref:Uncharacterized protein n=1 Tax=Nitrospira lenta TaxID=1436998 RepID=A0A330L7Q8_9BACT|nr:hypothetical protein NITLEN_40366 [Nitrospira lenta]